MGWTTPRTWTDGEIPNASMMNQQIRDNALYLYTYKMGFGATQSLPTRVLGTTYTNSSGKLLHVLVTMSNTNELECSVTVGGVVQGYVGRHDAIASYLPISFLVAPGETYVVALTGGSGAIYKWCETVVG